MVFSTKFISGAMSQKFGSFLNGRQGLKTNSLSDPFGGQPSVSGENPKKTVYQYPLDLGGTPNQGHFVMFYVNTQDVGKLRYDESVKTPGGRVIATENGEQQSESTATTSSFMSGPQKRAATVSDTKTDNSPNKIFTYDRAPTTRTNMLIALYMPASVDVTYASTYEGQDIGKVATTVSTVMGADNKGKAFMGEVPSLVREGSQNAAEQFAPGSRTLDFARTGKVISNRMEIMFTGVQHRSFSYTFKFLPKSQEEAKTIREIINIFKFHMLPEVEGNLGKSRNFITPDTFDIEYQWIGGKGQNPYLNKIATCVLENVSVKYGGARFSAHIPDDEGHTPPVESEISFSFKELELITKDHALRGY